MSKIITYSDGTRLGTFSQIKLDDGKRVLISMTQTEVAIFRLKFFGNIPSGTIWKHDIFDYLEKMTKRVGSEDSTPLKVAVDIVLECKSIDEIAPKFNELVS